MTTTVVPHMMRPPLPQGNANFAAAAAAHRDNTVLSLGEGPESTDPSPALMSIAEVGGAASDGGDASSPERDGDIPIVAKLPIKKIAKRASMASRAPTAATAMSLKLEKAMAGGSEDKDKPKGMWTKVRKAFLSGQEEDDDFDKATKHVHAMRRRDL